MFLDIGIGIFISILASSVFGMPLNYVLVLGSILLTIFPDIDFLMVLLEYGYTGKYAHNHRHLFHFPLVYIPLFGLLFFLFFGINWLFIFLLASLWHFIHDSFGLGWGMPWIFPFSRRNYKFFTREDNKFSKNLIRSWSQDELAVEVEKYGDPNWFKNTYLRLSPIFVIEIIFFLIAVVVLIRFLL